MANHYMGRCPMLDCLGPFRAIDFHMSPAGQSNLLRPFPGNRISIATTSNSLTSFGSSPITSPFQFTLCPEGKTNQTGATPRFNNHPQAIALKGQTSSSRFYRSGAPIEVKSIDSNQSMPLAARKSVYRARSIRKSRRFATHNVLNAFHLAKLVSLSAVNAK